MDFDLNQELTFFFVKNVKIVAVVEIKWNMTDASVFSIIICKIGYQKKFFLMILLIIAKNSNISLYNTILLFILAIDLRVEGR